MRRIGVVTRNEIISGDVIVGSRIGNIFDEPFRSYGYEVDEFKKVGLRKKFQSFLMRGEILRYDRYSGTLRRTKDAVLNIPFGFINFIYGIGEDIYGPDLAKQRQKKYDKGLEDKLFRFRLKCSLGRFELEGDCELSFGNYLVNPRTGKKEITSFHEGFMTLKNPKIISVNKKLKYANTANSICSKYFVLCGTRFDIYEERSLQPESVDQQPVKISDSYFAMNPVTPMIVSTKERLLGPYSFREL
ncbi:MAG: hypothetical protein KJ630_05085 [Proteobacteria bacterium]|nr:hypothetical protein [Pseudomonadota bacterium]